MPSTPVNFKDHIDTRQPGKLLRLALATVLTTGCARVNHQESAKIEVDRENAQTLVEIAVNEKLSDEQRVLAIKGLDLYWKKDPTIHSILSQLAQSDNACVSYMATAVIARQELNNLECPELVIKEK